MKVTVLSGGVIAAVLSSICCIMPAITLLAGTSSIVASVPWLVPARPYLAVFTVAVLGVAWHQQLKPKKSSTECDCEGRGEGQSNTFRQTRLFLGIVTLFALLMLSFPYYAQAFYPGQKETNVIGERAHLTKVEFKIAGMTCASCEHVVTHEVSNLTGVIESKASYELGNAVVSFDERQTGLARIEDAINRTGYKVTGRSVFGR